MAPPHLRWAVAGNPGVCGVEDTVEDVAAGFVTPGAPPLSAEQNFVLLTFPLARCRIASRRTPTPLESDHRWAVQTEPFGSVRHSVPLLDPPLGGLPPIGSLVL